MDKSRTDVWDCLMKTKVLSRKSGGISKSWMINKIAPDILLGVHAVPDIPFS